MPRFPFASRARRLATLVAAAIAAPAAAQQAPERAPTPLAPPPRTAIATNPVAIPFGVVTLDVERAVGHAGITVGVGGTWLTDDRDTRWADARVMYYPNETPLRGFAIGLTAGVVSEEGEPDVIVCELPGACAPFDYGSQTAPTIGVRTDYNWLVGKRRRMLVGIGLGAKRVLRRADENSFLEQVYGDGRFVIGLTF